MSERLFGVAKVGLFCDAVTHSTEKRKDGEVKVIQLTLRSQPFDAKLATALRDVVRTTLFKLNHPDPHDHLRRVEFAIGVPRQFLEVFASPDTVKASIGLDHVRIAGIYARTEKSVAGYACCFKAVFGPPSARELEYVEDWRNGQRFVTFKEDEASADFDLEEADEDAADEDDAQQALPDPEFETEADGKPLAAAGESEPARRRLLTHGTKKGARAGARKGRR